MPLFPKKSGEFIVKHAKFIKINENGILKLTQEVLNGILSKEIDVNNFSQHNLHPKSSDLFAIDWIFLVDTLNFCFWTPKNYTKWKIDGETGYFALCAGINRAMRRGIDITNPHYYSKITLNELKEIFKSDDEKTEIPLAEDRVESLHQVGKKLIQKYNGKFENVIKLCENSAMKLLKLIVNEFPCFCDEAEYENQRVSIYKRAQILIGDIWACYRGKDLGYFNDIHEITMFADYRVPQVLVHFGALEYTDVLMDLLKSDTILKNGSREEIEIRGASIYIVECVKDKILEILKKSHPEIPLENVNSILLDHFLWDYRRKHADQLEYIPFHKVLCIFY